MQYVTSALCNTVSSFIRSETLASAMTTAMIPEFQALEALKTESVVHCEVVRRVQELSEKHVRDYDSMRQEQHERLVKVNLSFFLQ